MKPDSDTGQIESAEVRKFAAAMDALFKEFVSTAQLVRDLPPRATGRALTEFGWPPQMADAFDRYNAGVLTHVELTAAVAKAVLISQNQLRP